MPLNTNLNVGITVSCLIGIGLSYYALLIETAKEEDDSYVAMCDISEHMSCSKVFMSDYGKGFGVVGPLLGEDNVLNKPNSIAGLIFYSIVMGLGLVDSLVVTRAQVVLCVVSNLGSLYLGYILLFILHDFCVVCVSTYVINFINLLLAIIKMRNLSRSSTSRGPSKTKLTAKKLK